MAIVLPAIIMLIGAVFLALAWGLINRIVPRGRALEEALAAWRGFLKSREAESRRPSPDVANYERRPEAITFQEPLSVAGSMARTQVPADLELRLFASEPDIRKPIAFAWDERGRLWVAETGDYPHGVAPTGMGGDSIRICEDTDGDGRADVREKLYDGFGFKDTHGMSSSYWQWFDGWVYGTHGFANASEVIDRNGRSVALTPCKARIEHRGDLIDRRGSTQPGEGVGEEPDVGQELLDRG